MQTSESTFNLTKRTSVEQMEKKLVSIQKLERHSSSIDIYTDSSLNSSSVAHNWEYILTSTLVHQGLQVRVTFEHVLEWTAETISSLAGHLLYSHLVQMSLCYSNLKICSKTGTEIPNAAGPLIRRHLIRSDGIIEPIEDWKNLITLCCLDPEIDEPPYLEGTYDNPERLKTQLLALCNHLRHARWPRTSTYLPVGDSENLYTFISELYKNTRMHGRYDAVDGQICGGAFVQFRSLDFGAEKEFLGWARGIPAIAETLRALRIGGELGLLEISVSDSGLGILDRFLSKQDQKDIPELQRDREETLRRILTQDYSTNPTARSGMGKGIKHALMSVRDMGGVVMLRTGEFWLYKSFYSDQARHLQYDLEMRSHGIGGLDMVAIKGRHPLVSGTHWKLWLPVPMN